MRVCLVRVERATTGSGQAEYALFVFFVWLPKGLDSGDGTGCDCGVNMQTSEKGVCVFVGLK